MLSWYIRPLFLIPFCYFAFRRRPSGIIFTLIALATSMFWFPEPAVLSPEATRFLAAEKAFILGAWDGKKAAMAATVPLSLVLLAAAFWRRSWWFGFVLLNGMAFGKIAWSYANGGAEGAWAVALPALTGLVVCDIFMLGAWHRFAKQTSDA